MSTSGGQCDDDGPSTVPVAPGADGDDGADGEPGPPGPKGDKGDKGDTGGLGVPGCDGAPGVDGDDGNDGGPGPPGATGATGPVGAIGATGVQGAPGADGNDGDPGDVGPRGTRGEKGDKGDQGAPGLDGDDGIDGIDGANFVNGGVLPGTLLAVKQYAPATLTDFAVAATTVTVLDATNATLPFQVPPSGIVDVVVNFYCLAQQTATICQLFVGLLDHTGGGLVSRPTLAIQTQSATLQPLSVPACLLFHLTGMSPGPFQVDLAAGRTNAVGCAAHIYAGSAISTNVATLAAVVGPLIMRAFASF